MDFNSNENRHENEEETSYELSEYSQSGSNVSLSVPKSAHTNIRTPSLSYRTSSMSSVLPSSASGDLDDLKCDIMVNYIYQQQRERLWISDDCDGQGVALRNSKGQYATCPYRLVDSSSSLVEAVETANIKVYCSLLHQEIRVTDCHEVAITLSTNVILLVLRNRTADFVPLANGLRLQVLPDLSHLRRCQKHQFCAFIADRNQLVVWDDNPRSILKRAAEIELQLLDMVWKEGSSYETDIEDDKKIPSAVTSTIEAEKILNEQRADLTHTPRRIALLQAFQVAIALFLTFASLGIGWRNIAIEISLDQNFARFGFGVLAPFQVWLGFALVGNLFALLGPVGQVKANSKFYSGKPPQRRNSSCRASLPHVTVQLPVYKEGLAAVIEPTIRSVKTAISTYEMQGGTANIFVNDDGMQLIGEDAATARRQFYEEHNIGWAARPKHNPNAPDKGARFLRRGRFKKASNMNYAMWISNRVEDILLRTVRTSDWTAEDEKQAYEDALAVILCEDEGRTWADGNVRIGDYILLIDSDTRIPKDCLLDAVSEMELEPRVCIIQFVSGVMNVTQNFFERGITFFTNLVYTQIRFAVSNGDVAPFVGHNALLRWSALQQIGYDCEDDHREKYWSESTVSEDFELALRFQTAGFVVRLAAYSGGGFQEGVSLNVYDELARWEKYAYGCSELVFHPLKSWPFRGPLTPLFRKFISSCVPLPSKLTILAYMGTYFALASAWVLTLLNYFLVGWYNGYLDHFYLDSFRANVAIIAVFTVLGNVSVAVLRYRIGEKGLVAAFVENVTWIPLLAIFLGGVSLHISQAILSHIFGVDMSWGATAKEVVQTTFFREIRVVLRKFKATFTFCFGCTAMIVSMARLAPALWRIDLFVAIWPLASTVFQHALLPVALNPSLMLFTW